MPVFGRLPGAQARSPFGLWFWVFVIGSLALGWFLGCETWAEWRASRWPKVPCEILKSEVEHYTGGSGKVYFRARIVYRYEARGHVYTSDQIRAKGVSGHSEFAANQRLINRFPLGSKSECHVNPRDLTEAVLAPRPDYFLPFIAVLPMFIWAVYEHVAIGEWFARGREREKGTRRPLSELRPRRRWVGHFLLGVVSMAFSGTLIGFLVAYPWWRAKHAEDWVATPCRIVESRVETEAHHQGWSFKAKLSFSYTVNGRQYISEEPDFSQEMDTSYADTEALVDAFPAGSTNTCYINPVKPDEAVLRRTWRVNWFLTLFMLAWFGLGCFFTSSALFIRLRPLQSALPWETRRGYALAARPAANLDPAQNALLMFVLCVVGGSICALLALWLGWGVVRSLARGGFVLLPACYAIVSAIGVWQSIRYGRRFLHNARNPSPKLRLRPSVLLPGQKFHVEWVWSKSARPFRLWLSGREEAYVVNTTFTIHGASKEEKLQKATFAERLLADIPDQTAGSREFILPHDVMPSFEGNQARIVWNLRVEVSAADKASCHEHKVLIRTPPG